MERKKEQYRPMVTLKPYMRCINKIAKKLWLLLPFFVMPDMST